MAGVCILHHMMFFGCNKLLRNVESTFGRGKNAQTTVENRLGVAKAAFLVIPRSEKSKYIYRFRFVLASGRRLHTIDSILSILGTTMTFDRKQLTLSC